MRNRYDNEIIGTADWLNLLAWIRRLFLPACILTVGVIGAIIIDGFDPALAADNLRNNVPLLNHLPRSTLVVLGLFLNPGTFRYMIAPLIAIIFVFVMAVLYVQDIYGIKNFRDALHYVIASLFKGFLSFFRYPFLVVDKGEKKLEKHKVNLVESIGGPGFVVIEPGSAVMFRKLRSPSRVSISTTYFLQPFETIAQTLSLDDQQSDKDEIEAMTRDGIKVILKDVHFRYRIRQQVRNRTTVRRSLNEPYPFDEEAMMRAAFFQTVAATGPETWNAAVERIVVGQITDFIAANPIDHLTAPVRRSDERYPRLEFNRTVLNNIRSGLASVGAELIWIDIGHLHIVDDCVDSQRVDLWSARWVGDADVTRASGEARRQAYLELGRAEAQADLILSIMDALRDINMEPGSTFNLRRLIQVRTAQLIDSIQKKEPQKNGDAK